MEFGQAEQLDGRGRLNLDMLALDRVICSEDPPFRNRLRYDTGGGLRLIDAILS